MNGITFTRALMSLCALLAVSVPAFAQMDIAGSYTNLMHEDYIERGPGSFLGDYTGVPLTDDGRAKALNYTSNMPSTVERQCLAQSPWIMLHRPLGLRIWSEVDHDGTVIAWVLGGNYLRADVRIWMDGRPHPSPNAQHPTAGFTTGKWEGDTLTARTTHVKTMWIRRGVGLPGSDQSTFTIHITPHDDLLTLMVIQEDPVYLTEPYVLEQGVAAESARLAGRWTRDLQHGQRDPVPRGLGHRPALPAGPEPGRGLHGADVQRAARGRHGVRGDDLSRSTARRSGTPTRLPPTAGRAALATAVRGSNGRGCPAGRPTSRATTAASAASGRVAVEATESGSGLLVFGL